MEIRQWIAALALAVAAAGGRGLAAEPPADFFETFNKLSIIVDQTEVSALDVARGTLLAGEFFGVGAPGVAKAQSWFGGARTRSRASMAGLFLALNGGAEQLTAVRRDLETNRVKRVWLAEMVGSEQAFRAALSQGESWKPLLRVLPSTAGCQKLAAQCLTSRDTLVRRAGLYWGYWFATPAYWADVRRVQAGDRDEATRRLAAYLLRQEQPAAGGR